MRLRLASMTVGLTAGVTVVVAAASAAGAYFYSTHHFETLLEGARATALAQGELVRAGARAPDDRAGSQLIGRMVEGFGRQPGVESVMLLDRTGVVRYSSLPRLPTARP